MPLILTSAGLGLAFMPTTLTVVQRVHEREVGVASAVMNTAQQLGADLGLAILTTVATSAAAGNWTPSACPTPADASTPSTPTTTRSEERGSARRRRRQ